MIKWNWWFYVCDAKWTCIRFRINYGSIQRFCALCVWQRQRIFSLWFSASTIRFSFFVLKSEGALKGQEPINPSAPLWALTGVTSFAVPSYIMVLSSGCRRSWKKQAAAQDTEDRLLCFWAMRRMWQMTVEPLCEFHLPLYACLMDFLFGSPKGMLWLVNGEGEPSRQFKLKN